MTAEEILARGECVPQDELPPNVVESYLWKEPLTPGEIHILIVHVRAKWGLGSTLVGSDSYLEVFTEKLVEEKP